MIVPLVGERPCKLVLGVIDHQRLVHRLHRRIPNRAACLVEVGEGTKGVVVR